VKFNLDFPLSDSEFFYSIRQRLLQCIVLQTKPLGVIWGKFEEYSSKNTIMFDDLRRNFLMNPQNGLKVNICTG